MRNRSLFNQALQAIDMTVFASPDDLPELNRRYEAAFSRYATAARTPRPAPKTDRCELCLCWKPLPTLDTLASDYTSERAAQSYSLEREDLLCQSCRDFLEAEYGTMPYDAADDAFERYFDR